LSTAKSQSILQKTFYYERFGRRLLAEVNMMQNIYLLTTK